ncbi:membrane protein [Brachybacterium phenoliresistens]|uniref:Membrane protein n=1 Tax=Brachybacterium phenoliresistens TaxID=396014 RepID=Z9JTG7_9MICO|nr:hypothetical protein [Brachybacterium phenoliresistens]EWS81489.1 membrane protein [Brachybacterium phenoliresistens]
MAENTTPSRPHRSDPAGPAAGSTPVSGSAAGSVPVSGADPAPAPPLPWLLIGGLASLVLLWPITALLGLGSGAPRALILVALIGAIWIGVVGLGRVPRPVLVLALTGLAGGVITLVLAAVLGGSGRPWWTHLVALGMDALWGTIAGLLALAVQQLRGGARR